MIANACFGIGESWCLSECLVARAVNHVILKLQVNVPWFALFSQNGVLYGADENLGVVSLFISWYNSTTSKQVAR